MLDFAISDAELKTIRDSLANRIWMLNENRTSTTPELASSLARAEAMFRRVDKEINGRAALKAIYESFMPPAATSHEVPDA